MEVIAVTALHMHLSLTCMSRSTIAVKLDDGEIVGTGDNSNRKVADNLAALSALYQLDSIGVVRDTKTSRELNHSPLIVREKEGEAARKGGPHCSRNDPL